MKKSILFLSSLLALSSMTAQAQIVYRDGFTNDYGAPTPQRWGAAPTGTTITHATGSSVVTFVGDGTTGTYASVPYDAYDNPQMNGIGSYTGTTGALVDPFDMTGNMTVYVVARASKSTILTLQLKDASGYVTNGGTPVYDQTVGTTSSVLTYSYTGAVDAGYGGPNSACPSGTPANPCSVDFTQMAEFLFAIEAVAGHFDGTLIIDYIQVGGTKPTLPTVSIATPVNGATVSAASPVSLTSTVVAGTAGTIDSVNYYDGTTKLASVATGTTYAKSWANPAVGSHSLTAVVFDAAGITNVSSPNVITVNTATGIAAAQAANISYSNLYPNPATNMAHVEMNLVTPSDVKIMVTDLAGKQIMNVSQGVTANVSYDFSVGNLTKGIYTVTYVIDGTPAKASLLVVQ